MLRSIPARHRLVVGGFRPIVAAMLLAALAAECHAIEMFTFFGDGSRIGLPSLEVPIEAYPGIPLRSDRIRARRAGRRQPAAATAMPNQPALPRGITIREMPVPQGPMPQPRMRPSATRRPQPAVPVAPAPEDLVPEAVAPPLAE